MRSKYGTSVLCSPLLLTHALVHQVTTVRAFHFVVNPPSSKDIYLGYLPLAHILELLSEFTMIVQGIPVGYSSPNTMIDKSTKVRSKKS